MGKGKKKLISRKDFQLSKEEDSARQCHRRFQFKSQRGVLEGGDFLK
jgi:hypothetical protein